MKNILSFIPADIGSGERLTIHGVWIIYAPFYDCFALSLTNRLFLYFPSLTEKNNHGY